MWIKDNQRESGEQAGGNGRPYHCTLNQDEREIELGKIEAADDLDKKSLG